MLLYSATLSVLHFSEWLIWLRAMASGGGAQCQGVAQCHGVTLSVDSWSLSVTVGAVAQWVALSAGRGLPAMVSGGAWTGGGSVPPQGGLWRCTPCCLHCWETGVPCQRTSIAPASRTCGSCRLMHHGRRAASPPPPALCCAAMHNRLGLGVRVRVRGRLGKWVHAFLHNGIVRELHMGMRHPPRGFSLTISLAHW